jgi:hypothetical protein
MRFSHWFGGLLAASALAMLVAVVGCGGGADKGKTGGTSDGKPKDDGGTKTVGPATPLEGKGTATLKGKVTYDGADAPKAKDVAEIKGHPDGPYCLKEDPKNPDPAKDRVWVVKDGNVANVAIWVRPPAGKYFKFSEEDKKSWPKDVKVDQPFCHFEPHVSVAFPKYFEADPKKGIETGQKIEVDNSATISHNTKWKGDDRKVTPGNETIAAKGHRDLALEPDWSTPVRLNCDIHKWMEGYIWVLPTPYAAVTKEDGTFEIKGIPAGAEVQVVTWHEASGFGAGGKDGQKMTLKDGETKELNFKVK